MNVIEGATPLHPVASLDEPALMSPTLAQRVREASAQNETLSQVMPVRDVAPQTRGNTGIDEHNGIEGGDGGDEDERTVIEVVRAIFIQKVWVDWFDEDKERYEEIGDT